MDVPLWAWLAVLAAIGVMLAIDLFAHRSAHVIAVREAAGWSVFWVACGVGFGVLIWNVYGAELGQQYFAGYVIEKSLAVDNVFVWATIFTYFAVPREYQHRVLFLGVLGALVFRGASIAGGSVLIANFSWVLYLFAAFLPYTGYRMVRQRNEHLDPEASRALRLFRRYVPMTDAYHGQRFFIRRGGILLATPLLAVLVLVEITDDAVGGPTSTALALYAGPRTAMALRLPVQVRERVVVDPTFATRDLVRSLHRTPRHAVLVLSSREARLFEGAGDQLRPVRTSAFPLRDARQRQSDGARADREDKDSAAFLRTVDRALTTYLRLHPAPLVLAGSTRALATFTGLSSNLGRLAGSIPVNLSTEPLAVLAERLQPAMEGYLLSRQQEALALLDKRVGARRAVSGMTDAWLAARPKRPEMLAVEQELFYPARVSDDGDLLVPATDVEHPEVIDDAVDELIELVLDRGGWVALVDDDALAAHGGVALSLRSHD